MATMRLLPVIDYDAIFAADPDAKPIICNDKSVGRQKPEAFQTDICMESKELAFVASCRDGCTRGNFEIGTICPQCKTEVKDNFVHELKYNAWFEIPDFLPPVLHPQAYRVLASWLGGGKKLPPLLFQLMSHPTERGDQLNEQLRKTLGRGPTYFYENFDNIIAYLAANYPKVSAPKARKRTAMILAYIQRYRSRLFVRRLPVLNQALHLVTKSGSIRRADQCGHFASAAKTELSLAIHSFNSRPNDPIQREVYLQTMYKCYLDYVKSIIQVKVSQKRGHVRTNILGSRVHCSFRAVITPICGEHIGDELQVPWKLAMANHKLELINLLRQKGILSEQAIHAKLHHAMVQYDPEIADLFNKLIKECPFKGLPVLFGRNPRSPSETGCASGPQSRNRLSA